MTRSGLRRGLQLGAALVVLAGPALAGAGQTSWYAITTGTGAPVGHAWAEVRETAEGVERTDYQETTLREQDARPTRVSERTVTRQDRSGALLSLSSDTRVGATTSHVEVRRVAGGLEIVRDSAGGRDARVVPLGPHVRFDGGEGLYPAWDPNAPTLEFEAFSLDALGIERVVATRIPGGPDAQGRTEVVRASYDGRELRGVSRLTLDAEGRVVAVSQPLFGASLVTTPADQATAQRTPAPFRLMANLMMKSPFRIPSGAAQGHIRYRFGFRDGMAFPLPQTGEQRVSVAGGETVLDICARCGPGLPTDAASLERARRPSAWLQSDDPRIRRLVAPIARLKVSDARKMEILSRTARGYLGEIDFAGHFSASETLDRRRGDCTEAAVLLAAFGRAAGIPTRTASGYVYSRERFHGLSNVFLPHSWTLAYVDGQWRSFDAALNEFDTTHIAVTIGDGDLRSMAASGQLASLLKWQGMAEVKARPRS